MDKIEIDNHSRSGATKYISGPDENGYIFKYFKNDSIHTSYSFEGMLDEKIARKLIPETVLIKNEDGSYYIKQKYIRGKLLKFVDINKLDMKVLSDLLELFNGYLDFCKNEFK